MSSGPASAFESETFGQDASFRLEQPIGSMSISPSGRDVALASKEGLHIVDLDSPYSPPRYLPHRTPWEVADVQWSPFSSRDYWVVSTSNQKALVWNLAAQGWQGSIEFVLHAHSRAITDINFSAHNPDVLATCAVDSFVHCWDLRTPLRPVFSFSDWFAGATQVKWSRQDQHVVASSHDRFLHIWDDRNGAHPVRTIEAHGTKIYGIDWNRFHPNKIVTCSLDRTIKFWDCENSEDVPERVIETPFPVWRARHTPFGWGLLAMPQRGSSDLYLYDRRHIDGMLDSGHARPVAKFSGHEGQVKEFLWRARGTIVDGVDHRDFQLVSWGTDRELRLHHVEPETFEGIGYEQGRSKTQRLNFTRKGAVYRTFRDIPEDSVSPIEPQSRGDGVPFPNQLLAVRQRTSTSVGMSKVPVSQFRGWMAGGRKVTRIGMHGKATNRQDINPIAWLKNVKIASWDPDVLAEEIRLVGEKFKRVDFESVDIQHRKAVMSLQAPWGEQQSSVYLRVEMRFPKLYPRGASAIVTVQKTGAIEEELYKSLTAELQVVSETHAMRKIACLEAIFRYLLREQNLEQIVDSVMGDSLVESKIIDTEAAADEQSSDSEDDQLEVLPNSVAPSSTRVPLAKGCGALWSDSGKLVCFFPPPSNEPASVLGLLSMSDLEDSQSSRLFEGFGRFHANSPARKATNGTKTADDDSDSDSSNSMFTSPSSSSSSSEPETEIHNVVLPYQKLMSGHAQRSNSHNRSNRSTTMAGTKLDDGQRRTIVSLHTYDDLLPARKDLAQQYRIFGGAQDVCAHNAEVAGAIGREDLASVWTLAGMILDNSVPLEWTSHPFDPSEPNILVVAKRASSKFNRKDSGVAMGTDAPLGQLRWGASPLGSAYLIPAMFDYFDRIGDIQMLAMLSCIFVESPLFRPATKSEGTRPAGHFQALHGADHNGYYPSSEVAESLLRLDSTSDGFVVIPHLAGHRISPSSPTGARDLTITAPGPTVDGSGSGEGELTRRSSRAPSMAIDDYEYLPSISGPISMSNSPEKNRLTQRASTGGVYSTAHASLAALTQSYSNSPPTSSSINAIPTSIKKYSPSSSLTPGWVSSGIFSSGGGNRAARTSFQGDAVQHERDTTSRSSASFAHIRGLRRDGRATPDASRRSIRSLAPSEASDSVRRQKPPSKRKILKTVLHNQDVFDRDGHVSLALLDSDLEWKFKAYRASYAQLLEVWQLHVQRAEILKFDGLSLKEHSPANPVGKIRRKTLIKDGISLEHGLEIRRCCRSCGAVLAAIEKNGTAIGWHCIYTTCLASASRTPKQSSCSICCKAVQGLSIPCLQCGHMTCYDCALGWFEMKDTASREKHRQKLRERRSSSKSSTKGNTSTIATQGEIAIVDSDSEDDSLRDHTATCPTGCGCPCATLLSIVAPQPPSNHHTRTSLHLANNDTQSQRQISRQHQHRASMSYLPPWPSPRYPPGDEQHNSREQLVRAASTLSATSATARSERLMSETGPDAALNTYMALARTRSISATKGIAPGTATPTAIASGTSTAPPGTGPVVVVMDDDKKAETHQTRNQSGKWRRNGDSTHGNDDAGTAKTRREAELDELNPWAGSRIASLGRGIGAGLSRGLSAKSSDSTIRKVG